MENNTLASQLAKAQAEFTMASANGYNPYFKSNFCELKDLMAASRPALTKYDISVMQYVDKDSDGSISFVTALLYNSTTIISRAPITLKDPSNMQEFGSVCSYMARYMYRFMVGVVCSDDPNDDDGNTSGVIEKISDAQVGLIKSLLKTQPEREAKLLNAYGITDISQLPKKDAEPVIMALKGPQKGK